MNHKALDSYAKTIVIGDFVKDPDTENEYEVREILENNQIIIRDLFTGEYMPPIEASFVELLSEID
jgi:hypothetical protein